MIAQFTLLLDGLNILGAQYTCLPQVLVGIQPYASYVARS